MKKSEGPEPKLVIVRYLNGEPAMWECSACRELFSVLSVSGIYVGFKDILSVLREHCRTEHSKDEK